jgi:hypothetical protein
MNVRNPTPRLKWHMLRRRKSDAPFLRENLVAALRAGAACEVDLAFTADGHALCLHDATLDRKRPDTVALPMRRARRSSDCANETLLVRCSRLHHCSSRSYRHGGSIGVASPALVQLDGRRASVDTAACEQFR